MDNIFVVTTEDREIQGAAETIQEALHVCKEYADCCDCEIGKPTWVEPNLMETRGHWRVSCYPNDSGMGFLFDLCIDKVEFYSTGTKFPVE